MNGVRTGIGRTGNEAEADALVVINKKVEWGILSVADVAVKWVNFRLHRSGSPRGTELAACDALDKAAVYMAAQGAGVGFAGYLRPLG
jgi:hypothetical protein